MRAALGILAGLVAGLIAMIAIAALGGLIYPSPVGIDARNAEGLAAAFPGLPTGAKLAILLSWLGGALIGAAIAKRIIGRAWAAWTIAGLATVLVLVNVMILPMPGWLQVVSVLAPVLGGLIANHIVAEGREAAGPA